MNKGLLNPSNPFLITMDDASEVFPSFQHQGTEFIYVLKGKIEYRHGSEDIYFATWRLLNVLRRSASWA